jgi:hypothetical protein
MMRNKLDGKGYGFLPEHKVQPVPFEEYAMDLIGPWTVQVCREPLNFFCSSNITTELSNQRCVHYS